jgi:spermidine/putrescine transport system ATP-binding protein
VRLEGFGKRSVNQLSGGQEQRVALARALINRPRALLLDEPLSALDLHLRKQMQIELRRIHEELGTTFIIVTHDQSEALALAGRIAIMEGGRILQVGSPLDVYHRSASVFVSNFIGDSNILQGEVVGRENEYTIVRIGDATVRAIDAECSSIGAKVSISVRPEKISLQLAGTEDYTPPAEDTDAVQGTIVSAVFLGATMRYTVALHHGPVVAVAEPFEREGQLAAAGTGVRLEWAAEDCLVLTA